MIDLSTKRQNLQIFFICGLLISLTLLPSVAYAIEYGGFGGRPAFPRDENSRTESIFVHTLEPGAVQDEGVLVVNNTPETKTILVYSADTTPSTGGAFACKQFSEDKKNVGAWITVDKTEVTLESGTNEIVPFTIRVPEKASVGEHNGCILIQEKKEKKDGQGVNLSVRTGLRVVITVPGEMTRKLEIVGFTVDKNKKNHTVILHPSVSNVGNVSIDADIQVKTKSLFGRILTEHGGEFPILRGETSDWNFQLKKPFWGGLYHSEFSLEYDQGSEAGVGVQSGEELVHLKGPGVWFWSFPKLLGFFIELFIALLLGSVIFLLWLSNKRKKWIDKTWISYNVEYGEDINLLAERFDVSWKLLVKVNKLKPPYAFKEGEKIKVPPKK